MRFCAVRPKGSAMMPAKVRTKYTGAYQTEARRIRAIANADPATRCWRTGLTLAEGRAKWGAHVEWQAGHIIDGDPLSPLAAELSYPNQSVKPIAPLHWKDDND